MNPLQFSETLKLNPTDWTRKGDRLSKEENSAFARMGYWRWSVSNASHDLKLSIGEIFALLRSLPDAVMSIDGVEEGCVEIYYALIDSQMEHPLELEAHQFGELLRHGLKLRVEIS